MKEQSKKHAIYVLIKIPYAKRTGRCFNKWREVTEYKRFLTKHTARMMMIRVSKAKLKVAMDRWASKKQSQVIQEE